MQIITQALRTWKPLSAIYAVTFFLQGVGVALQDTHSNNFVAIVQNAHRWLGFIHAMYALGCGIGPLIATLVAAAHEPSRWYFHYISLTGVGAVTLLLVVAAFYDSIRRTLDTGAQSSTFTIGSRRSPISATREVRNILGQKSVWILSLYFFFFLGTVITASGLYDRSILTRF